MTYRIGIDVGGTFTDLVLVRPAGSIRLGKASTTPQGQSLGVREAIGTLAAPDGTAVRTGLRRLAQFGTESLAVVFMFSFINSAHERRVRELAAEECPGMHVSLSHEVMPSAPEFERTSTTLVNAYVAPRIERYLARLVERLRG